MTALLGPLWRDEAGARLLAASVEDLVTAGPEKTVTAEQEVAEDGSTAEEDSEQVGDRGVI